MEEVEDIIPEEPTEFPEEVEEIPQPPPLKREGSKLKERVTCEGCGKSLSLHAYRYSHRCKARAPDEAPKLESIKEEKPKEEKPKEEKPKEEKPKKHNFAESLKAKPVMTQAQSQRPIRQKSVIQRTPEYIPRAALSPHAARNLPAPDSAEAATGIHEAPSNAGPVPEYVCLTGAVK